MRNEVQSGRLPGLTGRFPPWWGKEFFIFTLVVMVAGGLLMEGCRKPASQSLGVGGEKTTKEEISGVTKATPRPIARIETDRGIIRFELFPDSAPQTAANFVKLVKQGFYNGLTFHRVVPGFVIQGGDPEGTGGGGPGYTLPAEISQRKHLAGTVAMARLPDSVNPERRSSGSQFYICLAPQPHLDGQYTIFGQVVEGMDVVLKIAQGDVMRKIVIE